MAGQRGSRRAHWALGAAAALSLAVAPLGGSVGAGIAHAYEPTVITSLVPDHGGVAGGAVVTVTGSGFVAGETTVDVDGSNYPTTVESDTVLRFVMPPHAAGTATIDIQVGEIMSGALLYYVDAPVAQAQVPVATPTPTPRASAPGEVTRSDPRPRASKPSPPATRPPAGRNTPVRTDPPEAPASTGAETARIAELGLALVLLGLVTLRAGRRPILSR